MATQFPTMENITVADAPLVKQYQNYMNAGEISQAQAVLAQITHASNKLITADLMNQITNACYEVQNLYEHRYSPAYVVSSSQPVNQNATDFWFQVV